MFAPLSLDQLLTAASVSSNGKPSKPTETAKTLESFHQQQLGQLHDEVEQLPALKKRLNDLQQRFDKVEHECTRSAIQVQDLKALIANSKLEQEIQELRERIESIESGQNTADYFLRVGDILFSYTDAKHRIAEGEVLQEVRTTKKGRTPTNSVYSYFDTAASSPAISESSPVPTAASPANPTEAPSAKPRASQIVNTLGFQRDKALESYLHALDPDSAATTTALAHSITEDYGNCPYCDKEMLFNDTFLDCTVCGFRDFILVDSEKPSYKDPPREMSYYAYKKINHLNEWLAQFQAKETTDISPAVLESIKAELRKERITDMSKVKASKLKEIVKKLKLHRCYDHVAHILNKLNGISAPVLSREIEEKLRYMFKEIQFSFVKHCPKKRSNFLSYSFVLYKFCELLELDDYLPCFPLLKSREKLYMQDKIWQKICEDMGWEFIRTV
jgi:TolA-binding protein